MPTRGRACGEGCFVSPGHIRPVTSYERRLLLWHSSFYQIIPPLTGYLKFAYQPEWRRVSFRSIDEEMLNSKESRGAVIRNLQMAKEMKNTLSQTGSFSMREIWGMGAPPTIATNIARRYGRPVYTQSEETLATTPVGSFAARGAD